MVASSSDPLRRQPPVCAGVGFWLLSFEPKCGCVPEASRLVELARWDLVTFRLHRSVYQDVCGRGLMESSGTVYIIDPLAEQREALGDLVHGAGLTVTSSGSPALSSSSLSGAAATADSF